MMKPSEGEVDVLEIGHWVGLGSMMDIDEAENLGFGPCGDSSWPGCARQERHQARRTALNVALREQVAAYSAVEEDFRVLIMAMGS